MTPANYVNFDDLLKAKTHRARSIGAYVHIYNITSGCTEYLLKKNPGVPTKMVEREIDGRRVLVEEDIQTLPSTVRVSVEFSPVLIDLICERIVEGMSLKKICELPGMPKYSTLMSWRRLHPEVDEALATAREDRGEYLRDLAMETAEGATEDTVGASTLLHKAQVWAAGVDNARYSPKAKIEATMTATQIVVHTGIDSTPLDVTPKAVE